MIKMCERNWTMPVRRPFERVVQLRNAATVLCRIGSIDPVETKIAHKDLQNT